MLQSCKIWIFLPVIFCNIVEGIEEELIQFSAGVGRLAAQQTPIGQLIGLTADTLDTIFEQKRSDIIRTLFEEKSLPDGRPVILIHEFNGDRTYQAGYFERLTLHELRTKTKKLVSTGKKTTFQIKTDQSIDNLQQDPAYNGALFQISSNFSTLAGEGPDLKGVKIDADGLLSIDDYQYSGQAYAASRSTLPGLIYRRYGIFYDPAKDPSSWRQTPKGSMVNLLFERKGIAFRNGYITTITDDITSGDKTIIPYEDLAVGLLRNVEVVGVRSQEISQLFTSGVDFRFVESYKKDKRNLRLKAIIENFSSKVLGIAYEATLLAALYNENKKVVLTTVSGGAAGNEKNVIYDAIVKALKVVKNAGLEIELALWNKELNADDKKLLEDAAAILSDAKERTVVDRGLSKIAEVSVHGSDLTKALIGISASDLDEKFTALKEPQFIKDLFSEKKLPNGTIVNYIYSVDKSRTYQAGHFETYSIKSLREKTKSIRLENRDSTLKFLEKRDIAELQAESHYNRALFQVASNFSALEPTNKNMDPETLPIDQYYLDRTQGPYASISAAPGLFYRMYGAFKSDAHRDNPFLWRQTKDHQIELLGNTGIPVENGYIVLNNDFIENTLSKMNFEDLLEKIEIALHRDIQVTFRKIKDSKLESINRVDQIIHQVFTAAVDRNSNSKFTSDEAVKKLEKTILIAAYEGTFRAALINGTRKVVLTLIGGGVFRNSEESILDAICEAFKMVQSAGLDIEINYWGSNKDDLIDRAKKAGVTIQ